MRAHFAEGIEYVFTPRKRGTPPLVDAAPSSVLVVNVDDGGHMEAGGADEELDRLAAAGSIAILAAIAVGPAHHATDVVVVVEGGGRGGRDGDRGRARDGVLDPLVGVDQEIELGAAHLIHAAVVGHRHRLHHLIIARVRRHEALVGEGGGGGARHVPSLRAVRVRDEPEDDGCGAAQDGQRLAPDGGRDALAHGAEVLMFLWFSLVVLVWLPRLGLMPVYRQVRKRQQGARYESLFLRALGACSSCHHQHTMTDGIIQPGSHVTVATNAQPGVTTR